MDTYRSPPDMNKPLPPLPTYAPSQTKTTFAIKIACRLLSTRTETITPSAGEEMELYFAFGTLPPIPRGDQRNTPNYLAFKRYMVDHAVPSECIDLWVCTRFSCCNWVLGLIGRTSSRTSIGLRTFWSIALGIRYLMLKWPLGLKYLVYL